MCEYKPEALAEEARSLAQVCGADDAALLRELADVVEVLAQENEQFKSIYRSHLDDAVKACLEVEKGLLDPAYVLRNPLTAPSERFVCRECIDAIRKSKLGEQK